MIFYSIYMYAVARYNGIARPSVRLSVRYFDSVLGHFFFAVPIRIYSSDLFTAKLYRGPSDIFFRSGTDLISLLTLLFLFLLELRLHRLKSTRYDTYSSSVL